MQQKAASFEVRSATPEATCASLLAAIRPLSRPSGALVFCTGAVGLQLEALGALLADLRLPFPLLLLNGPGVMTERGELTNASTATGVAWCGGRTSVRALPATATVGVEELRGLFAPGPTGTTPSLLFLRSEGFAPECLWQARAWGPAQLFGAGTYGVPGIVWVENGTYGLASAACMELSRERVARIETAHACRLLAPPQPITKCSGALVEELGGRPALEVLREIGSQQSGQPLLFTVLASESPRTATGYECLVRGIQGIDPDRGALLISEEVQLQQLLTFAAHDTQAAREEMRAACLRLSRDAGGIAPQFGLLFTCTGRHRRPDSQPEADLRAIRERFPTLPIAGFQSAFEIAPYAGSPALQLYTGVFGVIGSPN